MLESTTWYLIESGFTKFGVTPGGASDGGAFCLDWRKEVSGPGIAVICTVDLLLHDALRRVLSKQSANLKNNSHVESYIRQAAMTDFYYPGPSCLDPT